MNKYTKWLIVMISAFLIGGVLSSSAHAVDKSNANHTKSTKAHAKAVKSASASPTSVDAAAAEDCKNSVVDTPAGLSVKACQYAEEKLSGEVRKEIRAKVDGKMQLSYVHSDAVAWSMKKAMKCQMIFIPKSWYNGPKSKVKHRIRDFALSHLSTVGHQKCLRLKHGSWWFNLGKEGKRKQPVKTQVHGDWSLMVQNLHTGTMEHFGEKRGNGFWLVCGNDWIWVALNAIKEDEVEWVKSEDEVMVDTTLHGASGGWISLSGTKQCPGGNVNWAINHYVFSEAEINLLLKAYVVAALKNGSGHASAFDSVYLAARANVVSKAVSTLVIDCNNPPEEQLPPSVNATPQACVNPGNNDGVVTVVVGNPNAKNDTAKVTVGSKVQDNVAIAANSSVTLSFSGFAPGTYSVSALLKTANKSATTSVTVQQCTVTVNPPEIQPDAVNQVITGNHRPITAKVKAPAGRKVVVHVVSCNGGTITSGQDQILTGTGGFVTVTVDYTAPGEVPPAGMNTGCETPAGKDRINWSATDVDDSSLKDAKAAYHDIVKPDPDEPKAKPDNRQWSHHPLVAP